MHAMQQVRAVHELRPIPTLLNGTCLHNSYDAARSQHNAHARGIMYVHACMLVLATALMQTLLLSSAPSDGVCPYSHVPSPARTHIPFNMASRPVTKIPLIMLPN